MKTSTIQLSLALTLVNFFYIARGQKLPDNTATIDAMTKVNAYFMNDWPDVGQRIVNDQSRASNIWTRSVYYEGLMAFYNIVQNAELLNYATRWATFHEWNLRDGVTYTRNADNQCAGQTYIELYQLAPEPYKIEKIAASIDSMIRTNKIDDWTWVDAIQMAMPVFAKLGAIKNDPQYWERMYAMYMYTRDKLDGGLYNQRDHLWWRDKDFKPPYKEPNGKDCYWSRGNGWAIAALVRVLQAIPKNAPHREQYEKDFVDMAEALVPLQRNDGFWNVSLHDATHYEGKETTGTCLFIYGLTWGINQGYLNKKKYFTAVANAWSSVLTSAVHRNGFLGFVQGTGKQPSDWQPVTYDSVPNFQDYGVGCFLLAGSEIYKLRRAK